jgi:hypothetical protein
MDQAHLLKLNIVLLATLCVHFVSLQRHMKLKLFMNLTALFMHKEQCEYVLFALNLHLNGYVYNNSFVTSQPNLRFSTSHAI